MPIPTLARIATDAAVDHDLTIVVPAYNEESRLSRTLDDLAWYLDAWGVDYRVLVVDDGSSDRTAVLTRGRGFRQSTISQPNQGKGAAVRNGVLHATGRVVAFTDADLPYELSSLRRGYAAIQRGEADVVFGARDLSGAEIRATRRFWRSVATIVFRAVVKTMISRQITDTQCGLKIFSHGAGRALFSRTTINGFAFDAEVVILTQLLGLRHLRIPVTLVNEYASTISLSRQALPMLLDVIRVRLRALRGDYDLTPLSTKLPVDRPAKAA